MNKILTNKLNEINEAGVSRKICNILENFIEKSEDRELLLISPFQLATCWNIDKYELLNSFLYASKVGIFDLEWNIKCPSCKGSTELKPTLKELSSTSHCDYCKIDITAGFDDVVEVVFSINQSIRQTKHLTMLEIVLPRMVLLETISIETAAGKCSDVTLDLKPGTYYMSDTTNNTSVPLLIVDNEIKDSGVIEFKYQNDKVSRVEFKRHIAGLNTIKICNNTPRDIEFCFSRLKEEPWVSGADIATNQFFRDYFSTELISANETFAIRNIVFVFTDIKGSTDLYERRGDSKAYYLVKEHFKIMTEIVRKYNGAIVKTIGDAIMATFISSKDGVNAVFEMHKKFDEFNTLEKSRDDIIVKIGIHRGSCIAVTSNDRLDYFGRTVNIAARVQGLSGGSDIMISEILSNELNIDDMECCDHLWKHRSIEATLKGIEGLFKIKHYYK